MFAKYNPMEATQAWVKLATYSTQMNMAAAEVIFRRLSRLARGEMSAPEAVGMVLEKASAFASAGEKAAVAAAGGANPVKVATAAIKPIHKKARSNARSLRR